MGISTLFEIANDSLVDPTSHVVETHIPLHVPGLEGLLIPINTRGHILKLVGAKTALVRWEVNVQPHFPISLSYSTIFTCQLNETT